MKKHTINGRTFYSDPASGNWYVVDGDTRLHVGTVGDIDVEGYRLRGADLVHNYLRCLELPASTGDYRDDGAAFGFYAFKGE